MSPLVTTKADPIVIIGAGVFGLSTAIHLAKRGYTNVKILDKQDYVESQYSYAKGCDAASADVNKIIRAAYGSRVEYQNLALEAITQWNEWNEELKTGKTVPPGLTSKDRLFINNGKLSASSDDSLGQFESDTIENMTAVGLGDNLVVVSNPVDVARADAKGFGHAVGPFDKRNFGVLDMGAGFVHSDKACRFALHKAQALGVQTMLGGAKGTFSRLVGDTNSDVRGVQTADGEIHRAVLTIMACGGWTPSLVPQLDHICETTAGSVCTFQISPDSPLWPRLAPDNFPTWDYNMRHGKSGGLYGFARDENGQVKVGYRGTKFTNPQMQADRATRSVPITRWTAESIRQLPLIAAQVIRDFLEDNIPELLDCEMKTRLCWYTDTFDNHFVIDTVPEIKGLMVATGGSGHGFKFLPTLGSHIVDRIEGKQNDYLKLWRWRTMGAAEKPYNHIREGVSSERALKNQLWASEESLTAAESPSQL